MLVKPDGNSWTATTQKEKYEAHAKLLEEYIKDPEKKEPRWVFYLAQSYRDAGGEENWKQSIKWYKERTTMKAYHEEVYFSQLMVGVISQWLKKESSEIFNEFSKCINMDRMRGEHYIPIIHHLQKEKRWEEAYIFSKHAYDTLHGKYPYPHRVLFLDQNVYDWKIADVHSVSCFYTNRKDDAQKVFRQVLKKLHKNEIPSPDAERISNNKKFFLGDEGKMNK